MKNYFACSFIAFSMMCLFGNFASSQDQPEPAAAIVNGERIPMSQLDKEMSNLLTNYPILRDQKNVAELRQARQNILDGLIKQEIMVQEGKKLNLEPQDKDIEAEYAKIKQRFPTEEQFQQALKQNGVTEKKLQSDIKRRLTLMKVVEVAIKPKMEPVTDKDITDFYEKNKDKFIEPEKVQASHILIKISADAGEQGKVEARKQIDDILQLAKGGSDFAELAKKYSQCPSAERGGDLGSFGRGQMVKPFEDAAFSMEVGQISDVVQTDFGYHIIKLQSKQPQKLIELKEVTDRIKEVVTGEKMNTAVENWVKPIMEKANIQLMVKN
jgi:peptidyl-prolyl cis-trans isomerase C